MNLKGFSYKFLPLWSQIPAWEWIRHLGKNISTYSACVMLKIVLSGSEIYIPNVNLHIVLQLVMGEEEKARWDRKGPGKSSASIPSLQTRNTDAMQDRPYPNDILIIILESQCAFFLLYKLTGTSCNHTTHLVSSDTVWMGNYLSTFLVLFLVSFQISKVNIFH
jgi:hypothetical protein